MKAINFCAVFIWLVGALFASEISAQPTFEFGVSIDPLVVPINGGTYIDYGPGLYDINGRGKITQAGSAYFTYWPFRTVGFSVGAGMRNFRSQVDYSIPDPWVELAGPIAEGSFPFSARGWGPSIAMLWRSEKWKVRIGLGTFDLSRSQYVASGTSHYVSVFEGGDQIGELNVFEDVYWEWAPNVYNFFHVEGQYYIFKNVYLKFGFETTTSGSQSFPLTLLITGETPETAPSVHVLNDYRMNSTLRSFSFGVGYTLGFKMKDHDQLNLKKQHALWKASE